MEALYNDIDVAIQIVGEINMVLKSLASPEEFRSERLEIQVIILT